MKRSLLLAMLIGAGVFTSQAQHTTPAAKTQQVQKADQKVKENKAELYNKLDITADQQKKIEAEYTSLQNKKLALEHDKTLTEAEKARKLKAYHKEGEKKIAGMLTPEQKKKMNKLSNTQKQKFYGHDE